MMAKSRVAGGSAIGSKALLPDIITICFPKVGSELTFEQVLPLRSKGLSPGEHVQAQVERLVALHEEEAGQLRSQLAASERALEAAQVNPEHLIE